MKETAREAGKIRSSHREQKGVCVSPQLLKQTPLQWRGGASSPHRRVHLDPREIQVPAEGQANHIDVLLAIAEGAGQRDVHWEEDMGGLNLALLMCLHWPHWPWAEEAAD